MNRNMQIAQTISNQVGAMAYMMMGTKNKIAVDDGLRFNVKGTRKCNWIQIVLHPSDTYTVTFQKYSPSKYTVTDVRTVEMVYADQLREIIESFTGLYLSL